MEIGIWGLDGPPESWKIQNAQLAGVQNTLTALGFEAYSYVHVSGTGYSREYWRDIDHNRYVQITYVGWHDADIKVEEIFP